MDDRVGCVFKRVCGVRTERSMLARPPTCNCYSAVVMSNNREGLFRLLYLPNTAVGHNMFSVPRVGWVLSKERQERWCRPRSGNR